MAARAHNKEVYLANLVELRSKIPAYVQFVEEPVPMICEMVAEVSEHHALMM